MIRRKHIRSLVRQLLAEHGVEDAPVDVSAIARALGIEVRLSKAEDDLSGFLYRGGPGEVSVIGVNQAHRETRRRFTIAHELGHFLLHTKERVHLDDRTRGFVVHLRSPESAEGTDHEEIEANLFAAELLMPRDFLARDLAAGVTIDVLVGKDRDPAFDDLQKKYDVSKRALAIRLASLGYVPDLV